MAVDNFVLDTLERTSRTFFIPILRLPENLQEVVAAAYLCLRAIDEIEDHDALENEAKPGLLAGISLRIQSFSTRPEHDPFAELFRPYLEILPEATLEIKRWLILAPDAIAPRVWDATAAMADRMAFWAGNGWRIDTQADLDHYTFSVAGAVGLLLSDIWAWYDGTRTNRLHAVGFGRALQAVNILRNQSQDLERGVDFFPNGWRKEDMHRYARANLEIAWKYIEALPTGPALNFCMIPYKLAAATLDAMQSGGEKLSRADVTRLVQETDSD